MEHYVFETEELAVAAEKFISSAAGFPRLGHRASDGEIAADAQTTDRWAVPRQRLDGKWVFSRVPAALLAANGATPEDAEQFRAAFPHAIETLTPEWFGDEEV